MGSQSPNEFAFESQRLRLSAISWGDRTAPPVVLVHGGRDQKRSWDWVARKLAENHSVTAFDLRGHGQSEWVSDGDYGVMDHVFDLATLMQEHIGQKAILIGHSLGGNIVLRYTGLFPDRVSKLVAIEGLGPSPKMLRERQAEPFDDRLRAWIDQRSQLSSRTPRIMADVETAKARMREAFGQLSDDQIDHLTRTGVRHNSDGTVSWAYDPAGMGRSPSDIPHTDFQALWERISCPTWLVYGATSWASNPQVDGRANHFRNAQVSIIEDAGHWLHHDQFDAFMDGLTNFLAA